MKIKSILMVASVIVGAAMFTGCEKEEGPAGPAGPQGEPGPKAKVEYITATFGPTVATASFTVSNWNEGDIFVAYVNASGAGEWFPLPFVQNGALITYSFNQPTRIFSIKTGNVDDMSQNPWNATATIQFKAVTISGTIVEKVAPNLDFNNYEAVAKTFDLD